MPPGVASPALLSMLFLVTFLTQRHQVRVVQRDLWIANILRCDRLLVMHMHSRPDQALLHADLTQPVPAHQERLPAAAPDPRRVEALDVVIVMHYGPTSPLCSATPQRPGVEPPAPKMLMKRM